MTYSQEIEPEHTELNRSITESEGKPDFHIIFRTMQRRYWADAKNILVGIFKHLFLSAFAGEDLVELKFFHVSSSLDLGYFENLVLHEL